MFNDVDTIRPFDRLHGVPCRGHDSGDLMVLFDRTFLRPYRTCLRGGADEPLYEPAQGRDNVHTIWFTRDYFASALHEVAHWCVAGPARRQQRDYGYWYAPDGRTSDQQAEFERVEVKPQSLEWLFSEAAGWRFRPSADNLEAELGPSPAFCQAIVEQVHAYCRRGVNARAEAFLASLLAFYGTARDVRSLLSPERFAGDVVA